MPTLTSPTREARPGQHLLTAASPPGVEVVQLTAAPDLASSHIYMESPVFTPDSRRFLFQRLAPEQGTISMQLRRRQYWLCDLDDGYALHQLTDEPDAIAPLVSPDGAWCYYFLNRRDPRDRGAVALRRVSLRDYRTRETVAVLDGPPAGAPCPPSRLYSLATIRSDGGAIATGAFFGDGVRQPGLYGVLVVDLATGRAHVPLLAPNLFNPHPQYSRSRDPRHRHDLLVQENFCTTTDAIGNPVGTRSGCYLRVVRDDGTVPRTVPCGDDEERVHGHQEWRGELPEVVVGVDWAPGTPSASRPLMLATPMAGAPDDPTPPRRLPGADAHRRNLAAPWPDAAFAHTAVDPTGTRLVTDWWDVRQPAATATLLLGTLPLEAGAPLRLRYLLHPNTAWAADQLTHPHPTLSPDGRIVLFNSTCGGLPQIWLATGYEFP